MKYENGVRELEENLRTVKGEIFNFVENRKKNSAAKVRKGLLNIMKVAKRLRQEIQSEKSAMPVRRKRSSKPAEEAAPAASPEIPDLE